MANVILMFLGFILLIGGISYSLYSNHSLLKPASPTRSITAAKSAKAIATPTLHNASPLSIESMRNKSYPGSAITIEQTLASTANYSRYLVSYQSDGLKIYGLLTVPKGKKPTGGWPVILFNHGYIPPASYSTVSSYNVMVDPLASAGFIVFKPDYRGNGNSEGKPTQPYISPDYVTDSMNALASIKKYKDANPQKIGVFGHSMGGNITLHELVITHNFKAAELLAGVVGSETNLLQWWDHRFITHSIVGNDLSTYYIVEQMIKDHGTPASNPVYWNAIDPTQFLSYINTPVQIQVGTADNEVPISFSTSLRNSLQKLNKTVDYHEYPGADHNLEPYTPTVMVSTVAFFNKYLK